MRRVLFLITAAIFAFALNGSSAKSDALVDDDLRTAIQNGLDYLVKSQSMDTGAVGTQHTLASTSLAGMAFISQGSLPHRGKYAKNVELAAQFVIKSANPWGYMQHQDSNMYTHGFATLFLCELYGTVPPSSPLKKNLTKTLKKSIRLLEKCQVPEGGWWYNPTKESHGWGADLSITVTVANALRAARNVGISVDKRVIQNAIRCIRTGQNPDGGFGYRVLATGNDRVGSMFARTAACVCCYLVFGFYDDRATNEGIQYLKKGDKAKNDRQDNYYFYATYYFGQAMFMSSEKNWNEFWPKIRKELVEKQAPDGSWAGMDGPWYSTATACIVLQMPLRYLPIYQDRANEEPLSALFHPPPS